MVDKLVRNLGPVEQALNENHHFRFCLQVVDELLRCHLNITPLIEPLGDQFDLPQIILWYCKELLRLLFPDEVLAVKVLDKVVQVYQIVEHDDE